MVKWKAPCFGATEAFLRDNVNATTDECIMWPYAVNAQGYGIATVDGVQRNANNQMCRLAHGEPFSIWRDAAHSCGVPGCVNPRHLRWATRRENMADKRLHGTSNIGERNGKTTITEADVLEIRAAPKWLKPLMEKYGLSRGALVKIRNGSRWAHVGGRRSSGERNSSPICRNGHPYDEANTRWSPDGYQQCRACDREAARIRRAKRRAA